MWTSLLQKIYQFIFLDSIPFWKFLIFGTYTMYALRCTYTHYEPHTALPDVLLTTLFPSGNIRIFHFCNPLYSVFFHDFCFRDAHIFNPSLLLFLILFYKVDIISYLLTYEIASRCSTWCLTTAPPKFHHGEPVNSLCRARALLLVFSESTLIRKFNSVQFN